MLYLKVLNSRFRIVGGRDTTDVEDPVSSFHIASSPPKSTRGYLRPQPDITPGIVIEISRITDARTDIGPDNSKVRYLYLQSIPFYSPSTAFL